MDSDYSDSDSDLELFLIDHDAFRLRGPQVFEYNDPFVVSGVLRAVVTEDLEQIKQLITSGRSVNINDNNGNTPLHVAVIRKNLNIVKFLLADENIVINARNFLGQTPLFIAVKSGSVELVQCLVDNGANVNLPDSEDVTPLHLSVQFPNIAHLLIKSGANIDVSDYSDDSPLHDAVADCHLETVCLFLYYNADANRRGGGNLTPFMKALISENHALQEVLFEYVDDFNVSTLEGMSTLALALTHDNPFVEEIIKRGAKVDSLAYDMCIKVPNPKNFDLVWKNLPPEEAIYYVRLEELCFLIDIDPDPEINFPAYVDTILKDTNDSMLQAMAERLASGDMAMIVHQYAKNNLNLDSLTKLICLMLQHDFQMGSFVIYEVFANYGYCELFKLLLFMDYYDQWIPLMITPRLIFDIRSDLEANCREIDSLTGFWIDAQQLISDAKTFCQYWVYRPLIDAIPSILTGEILDRFTNELSSVLQNQPKVPSLLELARNKTREHIVERLNLSTTCQYYTVVNSLTIAPVHKKILKFELKLYDV